MQPLQLPFHNSNGCLESSASLYLFKSRDKSKASSPRDLYRKQHRTTKTNPAAGHRPGSHNTTKSVNLHCALCTSPEGRSTPKQKRSKNRKNARLPRITGSPIMCSNYVLWTGTWRLAFQSVQWWNVINGIIEKPTGEPADPKAAQTPENSLSSWNHIEA